MKPVAAMTEQEKTQIKDWIRRWEKVGPILEGLRWDSIRNADTGRAIRAFEDAFETAIRDLPTRPHSGLVELQKLLRRDRS
jgi:hypothetical protein